MTFKIMVDPTSYKSKPSNIANQIRTRFATKCSTPKGCTPETLKKLIESGCTFCPGVCAPIDDENGIPHHIAAGFKSEQLFCIDIDNDEKIRVEGSKKSEKYRLPDGEYLPSGQALEILAAYEIEPLLMYHSFSNTEALEKYRICVLLDSDVTDDGERARIQSALAHLFGRAADPACKDGSRLFFGSTPGSVFVLNSDAITPKQKILDIANMIEDTEKGERAEKAAVKRAIQKAGSQAAYEAAKDPRFDATPEKLLSFINPNALTYPEWMAITAGYKNAGGDRSTWESWCSEFNKDSTREDAKVWESVGKAGRNGTYSIGTLKHYAEQFNPDAYHAYISNLIAEQKAERKKMKSKHEPPKTEPSDKEGYYTLFLNDGTTMTLPNWVSVTQSGKFTVSPSYLEEFFRSNYKFIYSRDSTVSGSAVYAFSPKKGVFLLQDDRSLMAMCKKMVDSFNKKATRREYRIDTYAKALHETVELLMTMHPEDTHKPHMLDNEENLVNFKNGMVNIITKQVLPHDPKYLSLQQRQLTFAPSKDYSLNDCPMFANYLRMLTDENEDRMALLLEYAGAVLSNVDGSKYKSILHLVGAGDSGKSQYPKLLSRLIGEEYATATKFVKLDNRFQEQILVGKRLVYDPDVDLNTIGGNALIMNVTGNDNILIERKGRDPFEYHYRGFLLECSNEMPKTRGNHSQAYYNRLLICTCPNPVPIEKQDKSLVDNILKNESAAIVGTCLEYYKQTIDRNYRFTIPSDNSSIIAELKRDNDPITEFLDDCCKLYDQKEDGTPYRRDDFYKTFVDWFDQTSPRRIAPSSREFYKRICAFYGIPTDFKKDRSGTRYSLVTLTQEARNRLRPGSQEVE